MHKIMYGVDHYQKASLGEWTFVTSTAHERRNGTEQTMLDFRAAWPKMRAKMAYDLKKVYGEKQEVRFVRVAELQERGAVHYHMLIRPSLPVRWWKDTARARGLGYQADVQRVENGPQAATYVAKYLAKQMDVDVWPENARRISTSVRWPEPPADHKPDDMVDGLEWRPVFTRMALSEYADYLDAVQGKRVYIVGSS